MQPETDVKTGDFTFSGATKCSSSLICLSISSSNLIDKDLNSVASPGFFRYFNNLIF
jgi:hypothetical protein